MTRAVETVEVRPNGGASSECVASLSGVALLADGKSTGPPKKKVVQLSLSWEQNTPKTTGTAEDCDSPKLGHGLLLK